MVCSEGENIDKVEKITKIIDTVQGKLRINTEHIKIFSKLPLPSHLELYGIFFKVSPYNPVVIRCNKCQRYGHGAAFCKSSIRCVTCGGNHINPECKNEFSCSNCGMSHRASDRSCSYYEFNKEVNFIQFSLQVSKVQAIFIAKQKFIKNLVKVGSAAIEFPSPFFDKQDLLENQDLRINLIPDDTDASENASFPINQYPITFSQVNTSDLQVPLISEDTLTTEFENVDQENIIPESELNTSLLNDVPENIRSVISPRQDLSPNNSPDKNFSVSTNSAKAIDYSTINWDLEEDEIRIPLSDLKSCHKTVFGNKQFRKSSSLSSSLESDKSKKLNVK